MQKLTSSPRRHARRAVSGPLLELADRIRAARVAAKLSQEQLALASGVARTTVVDLENGREGVSLGGAQKVLSVLRLKLAAVEP